MSEGRTAGGCFLTCPGPRAFKMVTVGCGAVRLSATSHLQPEPHGARPIASWSWLEFNRLPRTTWTGDIHCVTSWSKFDTSWEGVSVDDLLVAAGVGELTPFVLAECYGGYSTNVPAADLLGGKAMVATMYGGRPLPCQHGGPARLLVPHLYFWKSAKWCNALKFTEQEEAGFRELRGYHMHGDPWTEQRYSGDR